MFYFIFKYVVLIKYENRSMIVRLKKSFYLFKNESFIIFEDDLLMERLVLYHLFS